jgi:hypothetical protein
MNSLARTLQKSFKKNSSIMRPEIAKDELALGGYELVRVFEKRTDRRTVVVTAVSAKRIQNNKVMFRIATFREHMGSDGVLRRSPWLGQREVVHKIELEQEAMGFIVAETARLGQPSLTYTA